MYRGVFTLGYSVMMNCVAYINIGKNKSVDYTIVVRKHSGNKCLIVAYLLLDKVFRIFDCKV